jgi:DNA polymerase
VWCCAYAVDDGEVKLWLPGDSVPAEFIAAANNPEWVTSAFNDAFERAIELHIMGPRYGFPTIPLERRRCSQAAAQALALPASLKHVAPALGLAEQKDEDGRRVMLQMSRPRRHRRGDDPTKIYWWDDEGRRAKLYAYCKQDVEVERAVHKLVGHLPEAEQAVWLLDVAINERGIGVDRAMAEGAVKIGADALAHINSQLCEVTNGAVETVSQVAKLIKWLEDTGVKVSNIRKDNIGALLTQPGLPQHARRALELRRDGAHISAAKFETMLDYTGSNDRIRGAFKYHQAGTGRWASKGPQFQNLKKSDSINGAVVNLIVAGNYIEMQKHVANPLEAVGASARAAIKSSNRTRFIRGDFSGIESRVLAWIAGEKWKVDQWAKFDQTGDPKDEPYFVNGKKAGFDDDKARKPGKTCDLAFGYAGGERSWRVFAGDEASSAEVERIKRAWREAHPKTVAFWYELEAAAVRAVNNPGTVQSVNKRVAFCFRAPFLRMRLPNGRCLAYPFPCLEEGKFGNQQIVFKDSKFGKFIENRAWCGLLTENVVQAVARDLLVAAMQRLEAAGYPIIMHVHDEIVAEVPIGIGSAEEFARIMSEVPTWAEGLPVTVKAHNGPRFCEILEAERIEAPRPPVPPKSKANGNGHYAFDDSWEDYAPKKRARGSDVAEYIYRDRQGKPYQKAVKTTTKQFFQWSWVDGRWVDKAPKIRIPYRLPELVDASNDQPVFICEGEKDADNVAALGLIATTNSGGAGKWQPELNCWFVSRKTAYLLEDNDDAGRDHVKKVARALKGLVSEIRIVSFPELSLKGDVSDWLEQGHTKEDLLERCKAAPLFKEEDSLQNVKASDVKMKSIVWGWPNRFALGKLGIIAGLPDEGKGQILAEIAARHTSKTNKCWPCGEGFAPDGDVVLLSAEDDPGDTVVPRLAAAGADLSRVHIVQMVRDTKGGKRMFNLAGDLGMLRSLIERIGNVISLLIDPVSAYMGHGRIDTFRTSDVRSVLGPVVDLAAELMIEAIGIMHFNKKTDVTNALLRISDSLAFGAAARHVYGVVDDAENNRKLFVRAKNNLAEKSKDQTLSYSFNARTVGTRHGNPGPAYRLGE